MKPTAKRSWQFAQATGLLALASVLAFTGRLQAQSAASDPVAELAKVLGHHAQPPSAEALKYRRERLEEQIKNTSTVSDLARALLLAQWQDSALASRELAIIDGAARGVLAKRFIKETQDTLQKGDAAKRVAAAVLVGETAAAARRREVSSRAIEDALAGLVDSLGQATRDKDEELREAAARSLGEIEAPEKVGPLLQRLLSDKQAGPAARRAAAEAVGNLARLAEVAPRRNQFQPQPPALPKIRTYQAVVLAAGEGLADNDPEVRHLCADAIRQAATSLQGLLPPVVLEQFPPQGQPSPPAEQKRIDAMREFIDQSRREIQPIVQALSKQAGGLRKALADSEPAVCLAAVQALEGMANTRRHLLQLTASIPKGSGAKEASKPDDPFLGLLKESISDLTRPLKHADVRIRVAAISVLEGLAKEAAIAVPQLLDALSDKDPFVRWGAVRALREVAPDKADVVVPSLAKHLTDENADVRRSVASALQRYGPNSKAAVPALCKAAESHTDAETRLGAVQALATIGKEGGKDALSTLVKVLADSQKEIRAEAVRALGNFGPFPPDGEAAKALRKTLKDSDPEVRLAASHALLK
jgi:HEAT repeat protein